MFKTGFMKAVDVHQAANDAAMSFLQVVLAFVKLSRLDVCRVGFGAEG